MNIVIKPATVEEFFERAAKIAEAADNKVPIPLSDKVVTFEPEAFHVLMSGNRLVLLHYLRCIGAATLDSLCQSTGLARTTVSRNINSLEKLGLIHSYFAKNSPHGRYKIIESVYSKHERLFVQTEI